MRLILVWLAAAFVSLASAASLYDLVSEFPNECAVSSMTIPVLPRQHHPFKIWVNRKLTKLIDLVVLHRHFFFNLAMRSQRHMLVPDPGFRV
jgi:hypothetical protein